MTINKSQGQSLDRVSIYLPNQVFAHGQFYTGVSRVRDPQKLNTGFYEEYNHYYNGWFTCNVVYQQALHGIFNKDDNQLEYCSDVEDYDTDMKGTNYERHLYNKYSNQIFIHTPFK